MNRLGIVLTILLSLVVWVATPVAHAAAKKKSASKSKVAAKTNFTIHTQTADDDTFFVNSHLIETRHSVILIDTQMTTSAASKVQDLLKKIGKPLAAIFITHPHPDHYNNIATFVAMKPDVPVYATAATIKAIQEDDPAERMYWSKYFRRTYPETLLLPTMVVKAGDTLSIDTLTLQIDEVNGGESRNQMLIYLPDQQTLFVGDLVYNRVHANIREGHAKAWLANLQAVLDRYPNIAKIYPGHGENGNRQLLTAQFDYLTTLRKLIASRVNLKDPSVPLDAFAYQYIVSTMVTTYDYRTNLMLGLSLELAIKELLAELGYVAEEDEE